MSEPQQIVELLGQLVACDTRNPPRAIDRGHSIFALLERALPGFCFEIEDHGDGQVALLALRGAPRLLFNVHLDTVPAAASWEGDPLVLRVAGDRAVGLGACDVKGACAALVAAAAASRSGAAILFTSDEEAGSSRCVREFVAREPLGKRFDHVVVAEPTGCRAVSAHRGLASAAGRFGGISGHGSSPRALAGSANHAAVRWGAAALALAEAEEARVVGGLAGIRFNLGVLDGGAKSNMIADRAQVRFGVRPRPGESPDQLLARICACAPAGAEVEWTTTFVGPPLPPPGADPARGAELSRALGLPPGEPVDFWSEAALFAAAGWPALVYGPGAIASAHAAGEFVPLAELGEAARAYTKMIEGAERS